MTKNLLFTLCALALMATTALAAPIWIDDFNVPASSQFDLTVTGVAPPTITSTTPIPANTGLPAADVLGSARVGTLSRFVGVLGSNQDQLSVNKSVMGWLTLDTDTSSSTKWEMDWNGTGTLGSGAIGASFNGLNAIILSYISDKPGALLTISVYSSAANYSTYTLTLAQSDTPVSVTAFFNAFTNFGTGANWAGASGINWVTLAYDGYKGGVGSVTGNDMRIDYIGADYVPEPTTLVLIGSALLGLGLWRRKRLV